MERGTKSGGGRRLNGEMKLNHDESSSSVSGIITYTFSTYVSRLYIYMYAYFAFNNRNRRNNPNVVTREINPPRLGHFENWIHIGDKHFYSLAFAHGFSKWMEQNFFNRDPSSRNESIQIFPPCNFSLSLDTIASSILPTSIQLLRKNSTGTIKRDKSVRGGYTANDLLSDRVLFIASQSWTNVTKAVNRGIKCDKSARDGYTFCGNDLLWSSYNSYKSPPFCLYINTLIQLSNLRTKIQKYPFSKSPPNFPSQTQTNTQRALGGKNRVESPMSRRRRRRRNGIGQSSGVALLPVPQAWPGG